MKFLFTLATILTLNLGLAQNIEYSILKASQGELFTSMKYSSKSHLLFVADQSGRLLAINSIDSLVMSHKFSTGGNIQLDKVSTLGAFCGYDNIIRFFDQYSLNVYDSVVINDTRSTFYFQAWFTKSGVYIGNNKYNYRYNPITKKLTELKSLESYRILDVHFDSDQLLLGHWDETLKGYDYKIKTLFTTSAPNPIVLKPILKSNSHFQSESGAYFMLNGTKVIARDVHKVYIHDINTSVTQTPVQERIYSMAKMDDNKVSLVLPYRGTGTHYNRNLILLDVNSTRILQSINVKNPPYTSNIATNYSMSNIYMLSLRDGLESSIIVIR